MFQLNFEKFLEYDTTEIGIGLNVTLKLAEKSINFIAM